MTSQASARAGLCHGAAMDRYDPHARSLEPPCASTTTATFLRRDEDSIIARWTPTGPLP
jgi:hypothetical protein